MVCIEESDGDSGRLAVVVAQVDFSWHAIRDRFLPSADIHWTTYDPVDDPLSLGPATNYPRLQSPVLPFPPFSNTVDEVLTVPLRFESEEHCFRIGGTEDVACE